MPRHYSPKAPMDLRSLARAHTEMGIKVLAGIAHKGKSENARVAAVGLLLERGWGKAPATIEGSANIEVVVRHILEGSSTPRPVAAIEHETVLSDDNTVSKRER